MVNILVVEDDSKQRENIVKMIQGVDGDLNVYEAESKEQAIKTLQETYINFFYIDISLKNSSGLELAFEIRKMGKYKFNWIVFITTHIQYMLQAFKEIHCYDYIIKPYDKDEVIKMTKELIEGSHIHREQEKKDKHVIFDLKNGINIKLNVDEIIFIEINLRIMTVHTQNGNYEVKKLSLNKALKIINCDNIVQSHKSFVINTNHIKKIESISSKLWKINFSNCKEKAFLSYKFKDVIMERFK
ncbi:LytTR family DNA-binding domain-containing protein [Clostridium sp. OS1-26]|uniref:LytR/AlgR family response regulator transcription factor n=1 Tax=Clostridium sp. OS1-26 TaxID=3070681 RepID=UPI0027E07DF2|nr:LytTR family DNA-binding domain-containing protein [Clostridium sp. OS1-26]WML36636.1 LytTR family DNA-binding domain-containing protein [Clostridium sp. OS1-26]